MVIVIGSVLARPETIDKIEEISLVHVRRSLTEPGCVSHAVHRDLEDPLHLVFVEHWADTDALRQHFAVPASGAFVTELAALLSARPEMTIYEAEPANI